MLLLYTADYVITESIESNTHLPFLTESDFLRYPDDDEEFLTEEDFRNGDLLSIDSQSAFVRVLSGKSSHHGDIRGKAAWKLKTRRKGARRNGVITGIKKWPRGRIPYVISGQYSERERAILARSFQEYHRRTCVRFVARTPLDRDYLYIGKIDGCFSDVGRAGGRQELSLDDGCLQYDTAIHELMHSVGFYHEHERWDRDNYITILWQNIDREAYDQFGKVDLSESSYYGQTYDYFSIMHYDSLAFSKNGYETMIAKQPGMTSVIGTAIDFSPIDILKMNLMYQCGRRGNAEMGELIYPPSVALPLPIAPSIIPGDDCVDKTNLCWRWLDRCNSFFFEKVMTEFCPYSCGFCTVKSVVVARSVMKASSDSNSEGTD
ncbi:shTK domain protein [Dictyocaulus viviparus]|uniref:Metalloendopeptidase n=1 Tax=Dictyocaulus viviparus TaxID=29172 RepID=A0A0D8XGH5_DICVI|nr:shTK domain protein [Dictyocaulus viviparus]